MKKKWLILTTFIIALIIIISIGVLFWIKNSPSNHQSELLEKEKLNNKGEIPKKFTSTMLRRANDAFSKGIILNDPENDWYLPPEGTMQWDKPDNPKPYPLPFTDFKSVSLGADEEYLYVKFNYYGEFPKAMPSYNGDDIFSTGAKITEMTYVTKDDKIDSADLTNGVTYVQFTGNEKTEGYFPLDNPSTGQLAMISPSGEDKNREVIYKTMDGAGFYSGGPGYDYLLSAFPLEEFGISYGDEINFSIATETGSNKWHHESIDLILDKNNSKFGAIIVWKTGSDKYETYLQKD